MKLKQVEEKLYLLKNMIRAEQDELNLKRMVWKELGVIGEFETYRQYSYNHLDLNVLLLDLGILHQNTYVKSGELLEEDKEKLKHIQIPEKYILRFTASKDFREQISDSQFDSNINNVGLFAKVALWRESFNKFELLNSRWEKERMRALESSGCKLSKKVTISSGMISIVESPSRYRTDMVVDILGLETILKRARVDQNKLVEYTARGFLKKKEINNLRKVIAVNRRYLLMTTQKEMKKKEYWNAKLIKLSELSQR
ncbi:hypothetical protein [Paenibacillus sp. V4I7]|uniref:hypothetical protein n=1 Tax=Paenibacillus sp. V4I7 TaxID=3042307 RepID=UPI0027D85A89|nr:hypothetical protein [Paenibacillus sp. V4I7]